MEDRENEQEWHPTHLRVIVLRASSLRSKRTSSNSYVVIQLQKQKFRTSIASHSLSTEWHEECLQQLPSVLDDSEEHSLILTVMHQSLHYFNQFLGRVSLPRAQLFQDKTQKKNEFCGSRKGRKYKAYKETQSHSSSMTNNEDSSSSSMNTELETSATKSGPKLGSALPIVAAAVAGRKPTSTTQLQKLTYDYKELSSEAMHLTASSPYVSQSEHPNTLEQFGSIFTQPPKKTSKPLKEERSPEAAGIAMEPWQASLPPLHAAGPSKITSQAQTLHLSAVSLHQTTGSPSATSMTSRFHRCQLQLHKSGHSCLKCFGFGS